MIGDSNSPWGGVPTGSVVSGVDRVRLTNPPDMKEGDQFSTLQDNERPDRSTNTQLIAAALACGARFHNPKEAYFHTVEKADGDGREQHQVTWVLNSAQHIEFRLPSGETERITFLEFARRWNDEAWLQGNLDHPIAFLKYGFGHYKTLIKAIKSGTPTVLIRQGDRKYFIPADATDERVAELLALDPPA